MLLKKYLTALAVGLLAAPTLSAQKAAVKTDLPADAFANVNLGVEMAVAPKWTLDLSGELNAWTLSHGKMWRHWFVQPEARYWLCDRFAGHFFGLHLMAGQYNIGHIDVPFSIFGTHFSRLKESRYQGWYGGAGIAYGYAWAVAEHWNIEAEIGFGWAYTRYDRFRCQGCGRKMESDRPHNYVGPTKAAINLVYTF